MKKLLYTIFVISLLSSCNLGIDYDILFPPDPEPQQQPDTCHVLEHLGDTVFTVLSTRFFNGKPDKVVWHYRSEGSTEHVTSDSLHELIDIVFPGNSFTYKYYESDSASALFIDNATSEMFVPGHIRFWTRDAVGQKALMTSQGQRFYVYGALTYDEAIYEAGHRLNFIAFNYSGTNWKQEQNDTFGRTIMHFDLCKHGEERAQFQNFTEPILITQTVIDSAALYQWILVQQMQDGSFVVIKA